jgi:hypothetical protein
MVDARNQPLIPAHAVTLRKVAQEPPIEVFTCIIIPVAAINDCSIDGLSIDLRSDRRTCPFSVTHDVRNSNTVKPSAESFLRDAKIT